MQDAKAASTGFSLEKGLRGKVEIFQEPVFIGWAACAAARCALPACRLGSPPQSPGPRAEPRQQPHSPRGGQLPLCPRGKTRNTAELIGLCHPQRCVLLS